MNQELLQSIIIFFVICAFNFLVKLENITKNNNLNIDSLSQLFLNSICAGIVGMMAWFCLDLDGSIVKWIEKVIGIVIDKKVAIVMSILIGFFHKELINSFKKNILKKGKK